jgi:hypothetical protein
MRLIIAALFRLHVIHPLRKLGLVIPWTLEEILEEWFGGGVHLHWDRDDVERAFNLATRIRGLDWVLGEERDTAAFRNFPGIGRRGGYQEFLRVYWFGIRMASIVGAPGAEDLIERVITNDPDSSEEATAIHLLRASHPETELEIEPSVTVGSREKKPDFRIRKRKEPWVYVEITKLHSSNASIRVQELLGRVVDGVMSVEHPFLLEVILDREPTAEEEDAIVSDAIASARAARDGVRATVTDVAAILVKSGDPRVVVPSPISNDDRPRMAISRAILGAGALNRQLVARVPFAEPRAEEILRNKAKQLPANECGLLMVNVNSQPTAFESWSKRIPERFTPQQHTRVAGVVLFMHATSAGKHGLIWVPYVKLIANPYAAVPLPSWISERVAQIRENTLRLSGRRD